MNRADFLRNQARTLRTVAARLEREADRLDGDDPAALVRAYRHRRGLTQAALAAELGIAHQTVKAWETGRSRPSIAHLARLREEDSDVHPTIP